MNRELFDYANRRDLSVSEIAPGSDTVLTCRDFIDADIMPWERCCVECHAPEIFGMRLPPEDRARNEFYNGIHTVEDDFVMVSLVYLIDGYTAEVCCGGRHFVEGAATVEVREWIRMMRPDEKKEQR